jgi:two-component system, chemotaxis family, protein-glutamate methylesterase/glutaminase
MAIKRIRTLIVDDSAVVRKLLTERLSQDPEIEVVGSATDPYVARDKIRELNPDVLTLDIEMPRMDGLTFLKILMKHHPLPVIVISSLTKEGSDKSLEALQAGAVDVLPKAGGSYSVCLDTAVLAEMIKAAARARVHPNVLPPAAPVGRTVRVSSSAGATTVCRYRPRQIILMGASTGGTEALREILTQLPADVPGICIVQHIPPVFSLAFAERLNQLCQFEVHEAKHGDRVQPGLALVAPGGYHMVLKWDGTHHSVELNQGPMVHHQRPAVDVLFSSAARVGSSPHALAVLCTGMGSDGAAGMKELRNAGAETVAQNEETCVVFGMPREAIRNGGAQYILPLQAIAAHINSHASRMAQTGLVPISR